MASDTLPLRRSARLGDLLVLRPRLLALLLLLPPLLWLGIVYLGSLLLLLSQAFFALDDFSGMIVYAPTFSTLAQLLQPANLDILWRTVLIATAVTFLAVILAFPLAYYAARHARGWKRPCLYLAVMMPLWSSYLVKVYAWKLLLSREGAIGWTADALHATPLLSAWLALPVLGGPSLSTSYTGMVLVFTYLWLPFMILPLQTVLERLPQSLLQAAGDLGATPWRRFFDIVLPLSLPGVVAGAIFTFSLTLGDYIVPQIVGTSALVLGQAVYTLQGTAGNLPLAAAFAIVPILVMMIFLAVARRTGAFDAL